MEWIRQNIVDFSPLGITPEGFNEPIRMADDGRPKRPLPSNQARVYEIVRTEDPALSEYLDARTSGEEVAQILKVWARHYHNMNTLLPALHQAKNLHELRAILAKGLKEPLVTAKRSPDWQTF